MLGGVAGQIPRVLDLWDVSLDQLVALAQRLSAPDDLPFLHSRCFRPRHLQDEIVHFDRLVVSLPVVVADSVVSTPYLVQLSTCFVDGTTGVGCSLGPLDVFRVCSRINPSGTILDLTVSLGVFAFSGPAIVLPFPLCAENCCGPA